MMVGKQVSHEKFGKGVIISYSETEVVVDFGGFEIHFTDMKELSLV